MTSVFILTLIVLASASITRLFAADLILLPVREWVGAHTGHGWLYMLLTCRWCMGTWVSAVVVVIAFTVGVLDGFTLGVPWMIVPMLVFAVRYLVGLLVRLEPED